MFVSSAVTRVELRRCCSSSEEQNPLICCFTRAKLSVKAVRLLFSLNLEDFNSSSLGCVWGWWMFAAFSLSPAVLFAVIRKEQA